jgi:hypothetical protein
MEEKQNNKESKTRTSITIDPSVLNAARKHCESSNISVSSFIENCLAKELGVTVAATAVSAS